MAIKLRLIIFFCFSIETEEGLKTSPQYCIQLARILQYLECPQYLRKFFFPLHKDLKFSGLLNPLDAPHHLRQYNEFNFREGVISNKPFKDNKGSFVNIGLLNDCLIDTHLPAGLRVTVKLNDDQDLKSKKLRGTVVPPSQPRLDTGIYWGYNVRIAETLTEIFNQSPYENGYDLTIGTSDKGRSVHQIENKSMNYNHALIVFGGLQGLESAIENDDKVNVDDPSELFQEYVNVVPGQGSRTIRTEEAILIAMASLEGKLNPSVESMVFNCMEAIPQSEDTGVKQIERLKHKVAIPLTRSDDNKVDLSRFD